MRVLLTFPQQSSITRGVSQDQLDQILDFTQSGLFSEDEQAVLQYAFELTKTGDVGESTVNRVKEFLYEKQLVVLASTVALANFTNRFNHGLGIQAP